VILAVNASKPRYELSFMSALNAYIWPSHPCKYVSSWKYVPVAHHIASPGNGGGVDAGGAVDAGAGHAYASPEVHQCAVNPAATTSSSEVNTTCRYGYVLFVWKMLCPA